MSMHHEILIIGGGNAGLSVAARLRNAGRTDIGLIEPSEQHYYQPLWTLVGGRRRQRGGNGPSAGIRHAPGCCLDQGRRDGHRP
jgi:glycine/D-amino acid oxidase-like deaminating enzyme